MTGQVTENNRHTKKDYLVSKGNEEHIQKRIMKYFIKCMFMLSFAEFERNNIYCMGKKKMHNFLLDLFLSVKGNHSFCQISIHTKYLWILSSQHKFLVFADPAYFVGHNVSLQD